VVHPFCGAGFATFPKARHSWQPHLNGPYTPTAQIPGKVLSSSSLHLTALHPDTKPKAEAPEQNDVLPRRLKAKILKIIMLTFALLFDWPESRQFFRVRLFRVLGFIFMARIAGWDLFLLTLTLEMRFS